MAQSADCHANFMPPNSAHSAAGTARNAGEDATLYPALESAVDGAVIAQFPRQMVPLAAAAQPEDGGCR